MNLTTRRRLRVRPHRSLLLLAAAAITFPVAVQVPKAPAAASGRVSIDQFFVIGVDAQLAESFDAWKARGVNTVVRMNSTARYFQTTAAFDAAAVAAGLKAIRHSDSPVADASQLHLIATLFNDEPEINYCPYSYGRDIMFAARDRNAPSGVPFFTNYAGPWILDDPAMGTCNNNVPAGDYCGIKYHDPNQWCYGEYFRATDWISFGTYPRNNGNDIHDPVAIMDRIKAAYAGTASPLKPLLVYVEASNARCDTTYPNQWHTVFQTVQAIVNQARGVIYFPHKLYSENGCSEAETTPDGTTLRTQEEMTRLNTAIGRIPGATMQVDMDPPGVYFESGTTSGQIISGTRVDDQHAYYFTANDNGSTAYTHTVRFHGISNCAGKQVTVLNDRVVSNSPYVYEDRTLTLNGSCMPVGSDGVTVPETWSAYRYHVYKVPLN